MSMKWAVIVIDVQGDFTQWQEGSLAVPDSDEGYIRSVEAATRQFRELGVPLFATQDWHPPDHLSFASSHPGEKPYDTIEIDGRTQDLWPPHCIQGTEKARVLIDNNLFLAIIKSAPDPYSDTYSFYQDGHGSKTELDTVLRINGVEKVILYGIATEFCVKATALDLLAADYQTTVIAGLCRGVSSVDTVSALAEMSQKGVRVISAPEEVLAEIRAGMAS